MIISKSGRFFFEILNGELILPNFQKQTVHCKGLKRLRNAKSNTNSFLMFESYNNQRFMFVLRTDIASTLFFLLCFSRVGKNLLNNIYFKKNHTYQLRCTQVIFKRYHFVLGYLYSATRLECSSFRQG